MSGIPRFATLDSRCAGPAPVHEPGRHVGESDVGLLRASDQPGEGLVGGHGVPLHEDALRLSDHVARRHRPPQGLGPVDGLKGDRHRGGKGLRRLDARPIEAVREHGVEGHHGRALPGRDGQGHRQDRREPRGAGPLRPAWPAVQASASSAVTAAADEDACSAADTAGPSPWSRASSSSLITTGAVAWRTTPPGGELQERRFRAGDLADDTLHQRTESAGRSRSWTSASPSCRRRTGRAGPARPEHEDAETWASVHRWDRGPASEWTDTPHRDSSVVRLGRPRHPATCRSADEPRRRGGRPSSASRNVGDGHLSGTSWSPGDMDTTTSTATNPTSLLLGNLARPLREHPSSTCPADDHGEVAGDTSAGSDEQRRR